MTGRFPIFVSLLLAGCFSLERDPPEQTRYLLQVKRPTAQAPAKNTKTVLLLRPFHLATPLSGKAFVYRVGPNRFTSDFYHAFLTSPDTNLTALAQVWLERAGMVKTVVPPGSGLAPTHVLEVDVTELHGDYAPDRPLAVLGFKVMLLRADGGRLLFARRYEAREPLPDTTPSALVAGWNRAMARFLDTLEADLKAHLTEKRPPP